MLIKFLKWLIFGVVLALIPLVFHYICLFMQSSEPSIEKITLHGELLIIAVGMTGTAIGELFSWQTERLHYRLIFGGACTIILVLSALIFAFISTSIFASANIEDGSISLVSVILYVGGMISSGFSTIITETNL